MPAMLKGDSLTRLLQGAAIGAILTLAIGFSWSGHGFGWVLGSTAADNVTKSVNATLVQAYAPVCVERFQRQANVEAKWAEIAAVQPYSRDDYILKTGFATVPGTEKANSPVAQKCAQLITAILEAKEKAATTTTR